MRGWEPEFGLVGTSRRRFHCGSPGAMGFQVTVLEGLVDTVLESGEGGGGEGGPWFWRGLEALGEDLACGLRILLCPFQGASEGACFYDVAVLLLFL